MADAHVCVWSVSSGFSCTNAMFSLYRELVSTEIK